MSGQNDQPPRRPDEQSGLDTLMMLELPAAFRRILRLVIRHNGQIGYTELCQAVDELPEAERLSRAEMDEVLKAMADKEWLVREAEGEAVIYKIRLRRRASKPSARDLWDKLEKKLD